jgi:hypothetical protein
MYLLMIVQSKDGAKASSPRLVDTDKVAVCDLVERELMKDDCVLIFQQVEECGKAGIECDSFDRS